MEAPPPASRPGPAAPSEANLTPPNRQRLIALVLLGELVVFYILPAAFLGAGEASVDQFFSCLTEREYLVAASIFGLLLVSVQALFLLPLSPPKAEPDARPGWVRLAAIALSLGVVAGALGVYISLCLADLGCIRDRQEQQLWAFLSGPAFVSPVSLAWMRWRYRRSMPLFTSVLMAALMAGVLLGALVLIVLGIGQLIGDFGLASKPVQWIMLSAPLIGWAVFTPIITVFVRRGDPHSRLARIASMLLIGTGVELVAGLPLEVLMRRKTSCYCDTASFWALSLTLSVGAAVLGPAVYLAPVRRSWLRQVQGRCRACGYDMRATPGAARCPECGAGWKGGA